MRYKVHFNTPAVKGIHLALSLDEFLLIKNLLALRISEIEAERTRKGYGPEPSRETVDISEGLENIYVGHLKDVYEGRLKGDKLDLEDALDPRTRG